MKISLPPWLKPGVVAFHYPTRYLFVVDRLLSNGANYRLADAPKDMPGNLYELSDCRPASPDDCNTPTVMWVHGRPLSIGRENHPQHGDLIGVTDGDYCWGIRVNIALERSARSLAWFFDGELVPGDPDEILEALGAAK